jgi:hypothetical protein
MMWHRCGYSGTAGRPGARIRSAAGRPGREVRNCAGQGTLTRHQGPLIWINPVPEPKSVKNRMHVDVVGDKAELLSLGATMVRARDEEIEWDILADPEGNEFCVFAPQP